MKMYKHLVLLPSPSVSGLTQKVCPKIKIEILLGENNSSGLRLFVRLFDEKPFDCMIECMAWDPFVLSREHYYRFTIAVRQI